jgi:hypothetical protein
VESVFPYRLMDGCSSKTYYCASAYIDQNKNMLASYSLDFESFLMRYNKIERFSNKSYRKI